MLRPEQLKINSEYKYFPIYFIILLFIWFLVNYIQSSFTGLGKDEAYYWMYSQHLAWGYFDHPPLVAFFIRISSLLFSDEIGVRFSFVLAQIITLCITWRIIDEKAITKNKIFLFFSISASLVMFQVFGFIASPDGPLLLFTALFLLSYKNFLQSKSIVSTIILSISMAGLIYSKYMGALVIIFVVLSNYKILLQVRMWIAGIAAIALFIPHIIWQVTNDFPSFKYHLKGREDPFQINYFLEYLPNQMANFNPFVLALIGYIIYKYNAKDQFEKAMYFQILGFIIFFWFTCYAGHAEPHWTVAASIPMIILIYKRTLENEKIKKYVHLLLFPSILLLILVRLFLIFDILPVKIEFHGQKEKAEYIHLIANDKPVVFINSYQNPSAYSFYTGLPSFTLSNILYRKNQFDIWNFEEQSFDKPVILLSNKEDPFAKEYVLPNNDKLYVHFIDSFLCVQKVTIKFSMQQNQEYLKKQEISLAIEVYNPYNHVLNFKNIRFPVGFNAVFFKNEVRWIAKAKVNPAIVQMSPKETIKTTLTFNLPEFAASEYQLGICLNAGIIQPAYNSHFETVIIKYKTQ